MGACRLYALHMKCDNGRYFRHKLLEFQGSILSSVQDTALCYSISAIRALIRVHCPNINDKLQLIEMTASFNLLFFDALDISPRHFCHHMSGCIHSLAWNTGQTFFSHVAVELIDSY